MFILYNDMKLCNKVNACFFFLMNFLINLPSERGLTNVGIVFLSKLSREIILHN